MYYDIDEIKKITVLDICNNYGINLKRKGSNWWGRLRSEDKTPSFSINIEKGIWRDWGISKGGDQIALVAEIEGVDRIEAIKIIGDKFNITPINKERNQYYISKSDYKKIGIKFDRAIQNMDINLNKYTIEQAEKLEEKYSCTMEDLKRSNKEKYYEIVDKKALPLIAQSRENYLSLMNSYLNEESYLNSLLYKDLLEETKKNLDERIDIYSKIRKDVNLDKLKQISRDEIDIINAIDKVKAFNNENVKDEDKNSFIELQKHKNKILEELESKEMGNTKEYNKEKYKKERAEKVKEFSNKIEEGIKGVFESSEYKRFLKVMSKFHKYSVNNTVAILMQKPEATMVAGFKKWNEVNRNVKKGEKGIQILVPMQIKVKEENKEGIEEEKKITIFKPGYVFDLSQTEGEPLPKLTNELKGTVEDYENFKEALIRSTDFKVEFEDIKGSAKGYCSPAKEKIAIKNGMDEVQNIKTLIHEMAHAELHRDISKESRITREQAETEAESVAYVVSNYYNVDTSDYSFGYLAGWASSENLEELKGSLETIRKCANSLIEKIDENYNEILKETNIDKVNKNEKKSVENIIDAAKTKANNYNKNINKSESKEKENEI